MKSKIFKNDEEEFSGEFSWFNSKNIQARKYDHCDFILDHPEDKHRTLRQNTTGYWGKYIFFENEMVIC
jgi:hypothetical protein